MDITAKLVQVLPVQEGEGKNGHWKRNTIIVETDGQYPKKVCINFFGDRIDISQFKEGEMLTVSFDLESREFNGRWYTDVRAWRIDAAGASTPMGQPIGATPMTPSTPAPVFDATKGENDDLPF